MIEKGKQLTLNQRKKIEDMLNQRCRKYEIANDKARYIKNRGLSNEMYKETIL